MKMQKVYDSDNANDDGQLTNFDKKIYLNLRLNELQSEKKNYML